MSISSLKGNVQAVYGDGNETDDGNNFDSSSNGVDDSSSSSGSRGDDSSSSSGSRGDVPDDSSSSSSGSGGDVPDDSSSSSSGSGDVADESTDTSGDISSTSNDDKAGDLQNSNPLSPLIVEMDSSGQLHVKVKPGMGGPAESLGGKKASFLDNLPCFSFVVSCESGRQNPSHYKIVPDYYSPMYCNCIDGYYFVEKNSDDEKSLSLQNANPTTGGESNTQTATDDQNDNPAIPSTTNDQDNTQRATDDQNDNPPVPTTDAAKDAQEITGGQPDDQNDYPALPTDGAKDVQEITGGQPEDNPNDNPALPTDNAYENAHLPTISAPQGREIIQVTDQVKKGVMDRITDVIGKDVLPTGSGETAKFGLEHGASKLLSPTLKGASKLLGPLVGMGVEATVDHYIEKAHESVDVHKQKDAIKNDAIGNSIYTGLGVSAIAAGLALAPHITIPVLIGAGTVVLITSIWPTE